MAGAKEARDFARWLIEENGLPTPAALDEGEGPDAPVGEPQILRGDFRL